MRDDAVDPITDPPIATSDWKGTTVKKLILAACCINLLSWGCKKLNPEQQAINDAFYSGKPVKVSTAPDGTILWRVWDKNGSGKEVFFSSKGTFHTTSELQGKITVTKEHSVPNAE